MKIVKLVSRNIKNLKAIEITPAGDAVILSGKNGVGKSAIIDSIFSALTGKRLEDPIRHGEERADVVVDMGDFTVKKTWTEKGEAIQVYSTNEQGKKIKYSSPQTFLDEKIGELSFDPMAFKDMKSVDRIEILKKIVGLDFTALGEDVVAVYQERSTLNSRIKESLAHLKNTEAPDPKTPDEEILYKGELEKIQDLRQKRATFVKINEQKADVKNKIEGGHGLIKECGVQIEELKKRMEIELSRIKKLEKSDWYTQAQIPEVTEAQIIAAESALEDIEHKNADIRAAKRYRQSIKNADKLKKESDKLSEKLRRLDQDKSTQVANAKFPIDGLSLTDEAVMYKGDRFDRLSTGQQIRVSTAIGMALNPELKVIFIREGSLLDTENLKDIIAQAKDKNYQVWLERCDETGQVGFFIEAGEVKAVNGKAVKKEQ